MGRITTPKFELQVDRNGRVTSEGVDSLKEAGLIAKEYIKKGDKKIYLWGNSNAGKKYMVDKRCDYWELEELAGSYIWGYRQVGGRTARSLNDTVAMNL
ncbi:MAG: hypothetical protein Q8O68_01000 [Candidatus Daviesbacteria bacterium]|nr:hypothetical protein [Candidatus Daviesbacteria bacterium]